MLFEQRRTTRGKAFGGFHHRLSFVRPSPAFVLMVVNTPITTKMKATVRSTPQSNPAKYTGSLSATNVWDFIFSNSLQSHVVVQLLNFYKNLPPRRDSSFGIQSRRSARCKQHESEQLDFDCRFSIGRLILIAGPTQSKPLYR